MSGIYIHIPFCRKKCRYCDFYSEENAGYLIPEYREALKQEMTLRADFFPRDENIETVYFGGGTPSLFSSESIRYLLDSVSEQWTMSLNPEITLEVNPGTMNVSALSNFRKAGINRLSIGIQSFQDEELRLLGRIHTAQEAKDSIHRAKKAGFENIGLDLIFGFPGQPLTSWQNTLKTAKDLNPSHISAYALTWHSFTPLGEDIRSGLLPMPSEELVSDMFEWTSGFLSDEFEHYEISNYARPGFRCRHNEGYWVGESYLGLGPSAHSYNGETRFWNVSDIHHYMVVLLQHQLPLAGQEDLSDEDKILEALVLGLRRKEGIPFCIIQYRDEIINGLVGQGLARCLENRFSLTKRGYLLADEVALQLAG
jgi:oxygen-independent coproporphyrinogen-3 oxidase